MPAYDEILMQVVTLLQQENRVAYRILKRRLGLTDDDIEDLKADLVDAKQVASDEGGKVLVWVGGEGNKEPGNRGTGATNKTAEPTPVS
ncbi:MAG TPA: hypothetical protein VKK81_01045 [Candidatus Binatia bacterium]|nr:hypothetical protein [Candidatus Binatia bacterium]